MKTQIDDPIAALAAHRAALAMRDARERETRLAVARQREEDRITEAGRVAARVGRFLRRPGPQSPAAPLPLQQRWDERDQATTQRRDAA